MKRTQLPCPRSTATTIAIIWAGFKMIFQGARLADVANVLIGGTLVGGAAAFASFIVS
jgi:type IV secretion system protein VirB2